jgi:hypothetical protein
MKRFYENAEQAAMAQIIAVAVLFSSALLFMIGFHIREWYRTTRKRS